MNSPLRHKLTMLLPSNPMFRHLIGNYNYFRILSAKAIEAVWDKYPREKEVYSEQKTIISVFDGEVINPGLADCLKGICSLYYWCKSCNYEFKISFQHPFHLQDYLIPNEYNWTVREEEIYKNSIPKSLISYKFIFGDAVNKQNHLKYLNDLKNTKDKNLCIYSNTDCYEEDFHNCYHELFRPSEALNNEIERNLQVIGDNYISVSFRFTQLLGDIKDTYGVELSENDKLTLIKKCIESISHILSENAGIEKVLVTSDSQTFLDEAAKLSYVYILSGTVNHIAQNASEESIMRTFLDMHMISHAKKAYMVRTPIMYKSGFAFFGSKIGGVPFEERVI